MPFLSIVVPLFNKEYFVTATIESIVAQTFSDYEIIIVEDCSTDNSKMVVENLKFDKIKIIQHEINKGLSASRNTGIKNSSADFIVFIDADDLMKPTYLQKIVFLIQNFSEADLFATNYDEVYTKNIYIAPHLNLINTAEDRMISDFFAENLKQSIYCQSSLCVRKSAFSTFGHYDEKINYAEDVDFNIRANLQSKLAYSPEKLVQYVMFDENRITKKTILGKKIPDFNKYEKPAFDNKNLKKYLDINRYMLAGNFKKEGDFATFRKLKSEISTSSDISGLNIKQRILMKMPLSLLRYILGIKNYFLRKGIKISSFG